MNWTASVVPGILEEVADKEPSAIAWNQFVIRTKSSIVTSEAVLWEWLNGLSDANTRGVAAEVYRRAHAGTRIEVVPFQPELIDSAVQLYRTRPDKDWSLTDCLSFVIMERPI